MNHRVLFVSFFVLSAFSQIGFAQTRPSIEYPFRTPDFFVQTLSPQPSKWQALSMATGEVDCRDNIAKVVCLVEPVAEDSDVNPLERTCLPGGESYAPAFEALYDHFPPAFQKMFCSLRRIFIEKQFFGTAYAGQLKDSQGQTLGSLLGIRKSVMDQHLDLTTWASWKEQLSFGGDLNSYLSTPDLPLITTRSPSEISDFLYFALAHEFGHMFDFANNLNRVENCPENPSHEDRECDFATDSWGRLSWLTTHRVRPESEFFNRDNLCFYLCKEKTLNREAVPQLYADLYRSDFISAYAASNPWDDFADSLAYFAMANQLHSQYLINTNQGETYDIMAKLRSPAFVKKYEFITNFLSRDQLRYP